jgi:hypothetical protein
MVAGNWKCTFQLSCSITEKCAFSFRSPHRRRSWGCRGSGPTQSCNKGGPPMDGPTKLSDQKLTFVPYKTYSSKIFFCVRHAYKSHHQPFSLYMTIYRLLTTIILYLFCRIVFLLNFASMLLTIVLIHLLLCLLLSFLKKLKVVSFITPSLLNLFPLLLDGFTTLSVFF